MYFSEQESAKYLDLVNVVRHSYTKFVSGPALKSGIKVTHDFVNTPSAIPLPATFTKLLGEELGNRASHFGQKLTLSSPYPWNSAQVGFDDQFSRDAWDFFKKYPNRPYYRIINDNGTKILRYAIADRMDDTCLSCHNSHPLSPKKDWKIGDVRGILELKRPIEGVSSVITSSSQTIFWSLFGLGVFGAFVFLFLYLYDRKIRKFQQELAEQSGILASQKLITLITKFASDAIVAADEHGNIVFWNQAAQKILGHSSEEVMGKSIHIIIPEKFRDSHDIGFNNVCKTGQTKWKGSSLEVVCLNKSGNEIPIEISLSTLVENKSRFFVAVIRDISLRKESEIKLKNSEEKFRLITQSASDAIVSIDGLGIVKYWNSAAAKTFDYTENEIIGNPITLIIPKRYEKAHLEGIDNAKRNAVLKHGGNHVEVRALKKDGSEIE